MPGHRLLEGLRDHHHGGQMLADSVTTISTAFIALVGAMVVFVIVVHAFAWWTIRDLDQD